MTLKEIVAQYRLLYRNKFLDGTSQMLRKQEMVIDADDPEIQLPENDSGKEVKRFHNHVFIIDSNAPQDPKVWSSNNVNYFEDKGYVGQIFIDPELRRDQNPELFKMILAHEWLEVMYWFYNGKRFRNKALHSSSGGTDSNKKSRLNEKILFQLLKRRGVWQETYYEWFELHEALRYLLVSKDSLCEILREDFKISLEDFRKMAINQPNRAGKINQELINLFASKWDVERYLVHDRIDELLFTDT